MGGGSPCRALRSCFRPENFLQYRFYASSDIHGVFHFHRKHRAAGKRGHFSKTDNRRKRIYRRPCVQPVDKQRSRNTFASSVRAEHKGASAWRRHRRPWNTGGISCKPYKPKTLHAGKRRHRKIPRSLYADEHYFSSRPLRNESDFKIKNYFLN